MSDATDQTAPPGGDERPTQRTIAEITGLAVTTVSRALADDPKIAERTRRRVAEVAQDIGYVPDRAAQRLRTGRTNVIALVIDPHSEILGFSASMIAGISEVVRTSPFHLVLMQHGIEDDPMDPIRSIVRNRLADGIVLARTEPEDPRVAFLIENEFPFVTHGRTRLKPHAWLDYDNAAFARLAVERLVRQGRRRIAIVAPARRYSFCEHMLAGFHDAIAAHGVGGIVPEGFDLNSAPLEIGAGVAAEMARPEPPDGWICPGEIAAMAVYAALHDGGFEVRRNVDIVAKQTSQVFNLFRPEVSAIYEDIAESGRRVADLILARIGGADPQALGVLLSPSDGPAGR